MPDIQAFLNCSRACLIAPAGYGKTHFIVDCMREAPQKQLILTHTHAGVASLREKLSAGAIPPSKYTLCTISSLAKDFFLAYADTQDREIQEDSPDFFDHAVRGATRIVSSKNIQTVLRISFAGIFVDEYQDCNIEQHEFITALSKDLPLRVLGDPMQGIFAFKDRPRLVSFEQDLSRFDRFELNSPRRWSRDNPRLGEEIKFIRSLLESGHCGTIDYARLSEIRHQSGDVACLPKAIYAEVNLYPNTDSCLVLPSSSIPLARIGLAKQLKNGFRLLEAIDEKVFYKAAQLVDAFIASGSMSVFRELCGLLFLKSPLDNWFNSKGLKRKRNPRDREAAKPVDQALGTFFASRSSHSVLALLSNVENLPKMTCYRFEIKDSLLRAIEESGRTGASVYESMKMTRNRIRLVGRKNYRRSIGSTLLTKGQEFDHVIIVNQHPRFNLTKDEERKHFYVAISRACKSVLVFDVTDRP